MTSANDDVSAEMTIGMTVIPIQNGWTVSALPPCKTPDWVSAHEEVIRDSIVRSLGVPASLFGQMLGRG